MVYWGAAVARKKGGMTVATPDSGGGRRRRSRRSGSRGTVGVQHHETAWKLTTAPWLCEPESRTSKNPGTLIGGPPASWWFCTQKACICVFFQKKCGGEVRVT